MSTKPFDGINTDTPPQCHQKAENDPMEETPFNRDGKQGPVLKKWADEYEQSISDFNRGTTSNNPKPTEGYKSTLSK